MVWHLNVTYIFFNELQSVFKYVFDCIEENHELSRSMKYSIINLIYKEKGETTDWKIN
jgi:hypothetical protein